MKIEKVEKNLIDVFVGNGWLNHSRYRSIKCGKSARRELHYVLGKKLSPNTLNLLNKRT
jgi:hypothetical protein